MSITAKQMLLCMIFCLLISIPSINEGLGYTLQDEDPVVILFDEGHGQFFNRTNYQQALTALIDDGMKVVYSTDDEFNASSFEGIDIFVSTNPSRTFSYGERFFIRDYLQKGKSVLLLANPLIESNETLDGRGDKLNDILADPETGILAEFWTRPDDIGSPKAANVVQNEFYNLGRPDYLKMKVNSSAHEILSKDENVTSIVTYTCSIKDALEDVLLAPSSAISKTTHNEIYDYASDITLIGTAGRQTEAKVLLVGSSIMFSDLKDSYLGNRSWFESENNSILWMNMFDWLAETEESEFEELNTLETLLLPMLAITGTSIPFIIFGSLIYSYGSGKKVSITKMGEIPTKPKERTKDIDEEEQKPKAPRVSRRERRLQQLQKQKKK